jgi:hypothetical protein
MRKKFKPSSATPEHLAGAALRARCVDREELGRDP